MISTKSVRVVEVGPRDGLQNESPTLPANAKVELIRQLVAAGMRSIEVAAFVSPKRIPQMADSAEVVSRLPHSNGVTYSALVPNLQGFETAAASGINEVAVFASASETFSQRNINCSIEEGMARFLPVMRAAEKAGIRVRGYVSCVLGCPYEGEIAPERVRDVVMRLVSLGCYEISLGDTVGVGNPRLVENLFRRLTDRVPASQLAGHFHDTYGQALVNIYAALECGVEVFDASVAGLGGCPYAPGATGNVATEDLVYLLHGIGIETGIDLQKLLGAGEYICDQLGRKTNSKAASALRGRVG